MIGINKHQGLAPLDMCSKVRIHTHKQVTLLVGDREYSIDHDMKKVVREHPQGDVFARACEATGKLFSEGSTRSIAKHLTRELFDTPTDRQKLLQGPAKSTPDV